MAKTKYLTVNVHLTDEHRVKQLQAQYPNGYIVAPQTGAAVEFSAPWTGIVPPTPGTAGTWTSWVGDSEGPYPLNVAMFRRGGFLGIGESKYYWVAEFFFVPTTDPPVVDTPEPGEVVDPLAPKPDPVVHVAMPARRFIDGGELPQFGEGGSGSGADDISRDASRHIDGFGYAFRGNTANKTHALNELISGFASRRSWERLYVRPRRWPAGSTEFWKAIPTPSAANTFSLEITPSGQIAVFAATTLLSAVTGLVLNQWSKLDVFTEFGAASGRIRLYLDSLLVLDTTSTAANGTSQTTASIGNSKGTANTLELDVDDWMSADLPQGQRSVEGWASGETYAVDDRVTGEYRCILAHTAAAADQPGVGANWTTYWVLQGTTTFNVGDITVNSGNVYRCTAATSAAPPNWEYWVRVTSLDWENGSRMALVRPTGQAAAHADWTGNYRQLLANPADGTTGGYTSTTSGATLAVTTDITDVLETPGALGAVALVVGLLSYRGTTSGTLGYKIGSDPAVLAAITQAASPTPTWKQVLYRPSDDDVTPLTDLELHHVKGADVTNSQVRSFHAVVELAGAFAREDLRPVLLNNGSYETKPDAQEGLGTHNAPYPRSPWAQFGPPPVSRVVIKSGTYVGNATGQDLTFGYPVHWLFIRPVTALSTGGVRWWSTLLASHLNVNEGTRAEFVPVCCVDPANPESYLVRIAGADNQNNASGVTYQYIAVSDPGQRFMLNGAFAHNSALTPAINALANSDFLPAAGWFWPESLSTTTTARCYYKGPGHLNQNVQALTAAEVASYAEWATGQITSYANLHVSSLPQIGYSLWRMDDGSADPGRHRVVKVGSYVGDGTASRTVSLPSPASSRRPLWAMVLPHSGVGYIRDASHTGSNSTSVNGGADSTTAITAGGVDSFTVGTTLNTNGVTFDYFVLMGSDASGNNGWSGGGEYEPVDPDSPFDGDWATEPTDPDTVPAPTTTTSVDPGELTTDIATTCVASSTRLVNMALSRIGVTKRISSLATDTSQEADTARLVYKTAMDAVLGAFPWQFARAYASLVLVGGTSTTPVTWDYQYSYRAPSDFVKARRLVRKGMGRRYDPDPPKFIMGSDDTGELLYTDEESSADTPVKLEYTRRVPCPASNQDALFREALIWKLAEAMAPGLSKDPKAVERCSAYFKWTIGQAKPSSANQQQQDTSGDEPDWIRER